MQAKSWEVGMEEDKGVFRRFSHPTTASRVGQAQSNLISCHGALTSSPSSQRLIPKAHGRRSLHQPLQPPMASPALSFSLFNPSNCNRESPIIASLEHTTRSLHKSTAHNHMDVRLKLPYDVLLIVASLADRMALLTLMTTCRGLHSDCAKYVLHDPVILRGNHDIISFIYFMRPHKRRRWRHLRSLRFLDEPISPRVAEAFASVIPRALHLESLVFQHAEKTLGAHPDLPLAFAAIRTVKHLVIDYGYQHTCRMLEAMHWPLESAVLNHTEYKPEWQDLDVLDRMHPAALLKNSRATLKTLECDSWCECSSTLNTYPIYPKLESLYVEGVWCPRAAQWAVSYPSLKQLSVHTIDSQFIKVDEDDMAVHNANRLLNLNEYTTQTQHWNELEQFSGDALDLYLLGLTCRIRDVALTLCPDSLQFFTPVMATARPTRLRLSITTDLFSQPVPTYLHDPGLADLKSLDLQVVTWVGGTDVGDRGDTDVDQFLVSRLPAGLLC